MDENKVYKCFCGGLGCGWEGTKDQMIAKYVNTMTEEAMMNLAGYKGIDYRCPVCGMIITIDYHIMS